MTNEVLQYCENDVLTMRDAVVQHEHFMKRYHKLVLDNENLVYYVIKKLNLYKYLDELYDIGMIGLCKAARSFDSEFNTKFSTYAIYCIRNEIYCYNRKKNNNMWYNIDSLDIIIDNNRTTAVDLVKDCTNIENSVIEKETYKELYNAIRQLSDVEQFVINHTYGLNGCDITTQGYMLNLIYKKFGVQYSRQIAISRIKTRAIKKLKKILKNL